MARRSARWLALVAGWMLSALSVAQPIALHDARGQRLVLDQPARRIVALAPHFVENLFAIGAGERLVGVLDFPDHPPQAQGIPRVGAFNSLSVEAILQQQPDLVLAWQTGNSARLIEQLERLGVPVFVEEPRDLASISRSLRQLGQLSGREQAGLGAARAFDERLTALRRRYATPQPVSVFYQVWHEPLQTLNGEHVISALIEMCGGYNVFAEARPLAPRVSVEAVLARRPQVIVAGGEDTQDGAGLAGWQRWPQLPAVANGHVYAIPPELLQRYTARILDGATQLCERLERARQD